MSPQLEATLMYTRENGYSRTDATRIIFGLSRDYIHIDCYETRLKRLKTKAEERLTSVLNGKENKKYTDLFIKYK